MPRFLLLLIFYFCIAPFIHGQSSKRGLAYGNHSVADLEALSEGITWWYNWWHQPENSAVLGAYQQLGLEFVPMAWDESFDEEAMRNYLQNHPDVKYILGFNEPNFTGQANLTPAEAAAQWYKIEDIADEFNLKIVGPAMNYAPDGDGSVSEIIDGETIHYTDPVVWLDAFFDACEGCRIDYIAVHCYMNYVSALEWYIGLFKKYGKPIWLTEFCAWEDGVTKDFQKNFMKDALNYLENDPDVFRYAWFSGRSTGYPYFGLLDGSGELTDLGLVYTGQEEPADPGEGNNMVTIAVVDRTLGAVTNSDLWPDESVYTWLGIEGVWQSISNVGSNWVEMHAGAPGGSLEKKQDAWIWYYTFEPQPGVTYDWNPGSFQDADKSENSFMPMHENRNLVFSVNSDGSVSGEVTLIIENETSATISEEMYQSTTSARTIDYSDKVLIFPNPVETDLKIECPAEIEFCSVFSIAGQEIFTTKCTGRSLSMSKFPPGVYYLYMSFTNGGMAVKKVVKK